MAEQPRTGLADNGRTGSALPALLAVAALLGALVASPTPATADEMQFDVDDVEEDDDGDDGDEEGEDDQEQADEEDEDVMDFGSEEAGEETGEETDGAEDTWTVAVVAIPSDELDDSERRELEEAMLEGVELDPEYEAREGDEVLDELEEAGLSSCVTEPLCLADVGREAGVDRLLLGSVDEGDEMLTLNIDLFDVEEKLFAKYAEAERLIDFDDVLDEVEPTMKDIFDMRVGRDGPNYGSEADSSTVQKTLAYTAAGAAVASLGTGIYFGMDASSKEDDLRSEADQNDELTQSAAYDMQQEAENSALTANILYGSAAALGVVSGILFYVEGGTDVGESNRRADRGAVDLKPSFGFGRVGLDAAIRF